MKIKNVHILILFLFGQCVGVGCGANCPEGFYEIDKELIIAYEQVGNMQQSDENVGIYIDYSDGIKTALNNQNCKKFYGLFVNSLNKSQVDFYQLANNRMDKIEGLDKSELYNKIINEGGFVGNYAPLDDAVENIVATGIEAVMITDGELYDPNLGERKEPWARTAFADWLKKGNAIDFYVTNFIEQSSNKHLFFIFFIPKNNIKSRDNISKQFAFFLKNSHDAKGIEFTSFSMSNSTFDIVQNYKGEKTGGVNENLAMNPDTYYNGKEKNFEYHEYWLGWKEIVDYIYTKYDDKTGKPVEGGDALIRNLFINQDGMMFYKIEELKLEVTNITTDFNSFAYNYYCKNDTIGICNSEFKSAIGVLGITTLPEVFLIDNEIFKKTGEVVIKVHPNFDGKGLSDECCNILRLDISMGKVTENTTNVNLNTFLWKGLTLDVNSSMYNSILGALMEANPTGKNIYTYYIKTPANNYHP